MRIPKCSVCGRLATAFTRSAPISVETSGAMKSAADVGVARRRRALLTVTTSAPVPDLRTRFSRQSVRADQGTPSDLTGFRGEEEFGFNAEPYVRTGKFVKILGL